MKKLLLVCVMAACGGGGGPVDSGKEVKDLTPSEAQAECNYLAGEYPSRSITCTINGQSTTFSFGLKASDCTNTNTDDVPDTCTVTVGELEDCDDGEFGLSDDAICSAASSGMEPVISACAKLQSDDCQTSDTSSRLSNHHRVQYSLTKVSQ